MLTYHDSSSWHTAPESWESQLFVTQSTRQTNRVAGGGTTAGSTTAATTIAAGESTASTSQAGGASPGSSYVSYGDTGSTTSNGGGSTSAAYTRSTATVSHTTSNSGIGISSLTDTTSTQTATVAWPSTYTTTTWLGTFPATTETTTRTAATSVTGTRSESYYLPTTGVEMSSTETGLSFGASSSTASHKFPALPATVIIPDAQGGPVNNDVVVWMPSFSITTVDSSIGLFLHFFETTASGVQTVTADFAGRIARGSTIWKTYSLSTGGGGSSLDGAPWNSTEAASSSTIWIGSITGSSSYTVPGPATLTDYTYIRQTTSTDASSNVSTLATTATLFDAPFFTTTWNTWQRSYTTSSTFYYPRSTSTASLFERFSAGRELGSMSMALDEWQPLTTSTSWTAWDDRTAAVLMGTFTSSAVGGATTSNTTTIIQQTYNVTRYSDAVQQILVGDLTAFSLDWTMSSRVWQRMMPMGFLGFGDGFSTSSPVFAGMSSTTVSGTADTNFSLVASNLPRFIFHPDASIFATDHCWNEGGGWSSVSGTWLASTSTETGPRTTASFSHRWISTQTTTSSTSTVTLSSTYTAIYSVAMTGSITGEFFSEYLPEQNSSDDGIGRPFFSGFVGGAIGGLAPISSVAQTATFPPGGLSLTWETSPLGTTSSSTSQSTGPITVSLPSTTSPAAYSWEHALVMSWVNDTAAQILTASVHDLPDYPY